MYTQVYHANQGQFEEAFLFKTEPHPLLSKKLIRKRYIDDVFVLWEGSQQELNSFQTLLNESSEYLKFTMQTDERRINYLDVWIIKENDALHTDLYTKPPTDRNILLSHKNGLPYSQLSRVKRICGHQTDFASKAKKVADTFKMSGYKDKTLCNDENISMQNSVIHLVHQVFREN